MPKTLLFSLLLFSLSFSLSAQNWMPLNPADSIWQFRSTDNFSRYSGGPVFYIQSMVLDSSYSSSSFQQFIFKKGYSHVAIEKEHQRQNYGYKQVIKGKILGDSARIFADSSLFQTTDPYGFSFRFEHDYYYGKSWNFGKSVNRRIVAQVNQYSYQSIPGFGMDSIADFYLIVYDTNNSIDSHHPFNNAPLRISKNHGLIELPDLSHLDQRILFKKLNWPGEQITEGDNHVLIAGDEFHYTKWNEDWSNFPGVIIEYDEHEIHINSVLTAGNTKQIIYQDYFQRRTYPNGPITSALSVSNKSEIVQVNSIFQKKHSGTLDDSLLNYPFTSNGKSMNYYYEPSNPLAPIGLYTDNLVQYSDTVFGYNRLAQEEYFHMIGIGSEFKKYTSNGSGLQQSDQIIRYIKKGNQTWGTALNLSTNLNQSSPDKSLRFYPNPTNNHLNIKSDFDYEFLEILDSRGQRVLEMPYTESIDVSELSSGMYFIRLLHPESSTELKFIKN